MRKRNIAIAILVLLSLALGGLVLWKEKHAPQSTTGTRQSAMYQCSMHPDIISDKPGDCPICGMRLTKVEETESQAESAKTREKGRRPLFYRHPMDPSITSPEPAKDDMGMDYIPVYEEEAAETEASDVPGHAPFTLSAERQQMIGVKTMRIEKKNLHLEIRSLGRVAYDPELYNALAEYREAVAAQKKLPDTASPETRERVKSLVRAGALRLRVMGITDDQLPQMIDEVTDSTNLLLPGKNVWVYAQVYEHEADMVRRDQKVVISMPASRNRSYTGKVASVDPVLDPTTRTLRVRIKVETPQERLKPESFVHATIQVPLGRVLAVPEDSVLDTGEHHLVFVKSGAGRFEPRAVQIGREAQGQYEILSGIAEGEEVVTSANFLIDSESRFKAAISAYSGHKSTAPPKSEPKSAPSPQGHVH